MEKKPKDIPKPNPENKVSLAVAKDWTSRWRAIESEYNAHHECRAFNIPLKDLKEVINEEGVVSVRAYIGVEKEIIENETVLTEKLLIVGVNSSDKDMISSINNVTLDDESGSIYDFTRPCPSGCDPDSPLNG